MIANRMHVGTRLVRDHADPGVGRRRPYDGDEESGGKVTSRWFDQRPRALRARIGRIRRRASLREKTRIIML